MPSKKRFRKRKSSLISFKRFSNRQVLTVVALAAGLGLLFYFGSQASGGDSRINAVVLEKTDNLTSIQTRRNDTLHAAIQQIRFRLYASGQLICGDGTDLSTAQLSPRQIGDALNAVKGTGVTKVASATSINDQNQTIWINGNGVKRKIVQEKQKDNRFTSADSKLQSICNQTARTKIDPSQVPIPKGGLVPTLPVKAEASPAEKLTQAAINTVIQKAYAGALSQSDEDDQYNRIMGARSNVGQPGLTRSACLTNAARGWAQQMAANNALSHTPVTQRADGPIMSNGQHQVIYHDDYVESYCGGNQNAFGENVGDGSQSAAMFNDNAGYDDHNSFMTSPCHRYTIQSQLWNHSYLGPDPNDSSRNVEYCDYIDSQGHEVAAGAPGSQPWTAVGVGAYRADNGVLWVAQMYALCTNSACATYNNGGGGSAPPPPSTNHNPYGYVDGANCTNGVYGWAKDDDTTGPITVHIYVGGPATSSGTYPAFAVQADQSRSDVGAHAFSWNIPDQFKNGVNYPIYVYGINVPQGDNPPLSNGSGQFAINCTGGGSTTPPAPQPTPQPAPSGDQPITIYRLYNQAADQHMWTADVNEYRGLLGSGGWSDESPAFYDYSKDGSTGQPVYRLYDSRTNEHFFTVDTGERGGLLGRPCDQQHCWQDEGIAWKTSGSVAIYRLFNNVTGRHLWTSSSSEANGLQQAAAANNGRGWQMDGTAFYAASSAVQATQIQNKCFVVFNCGTSPAPAPTALPVPTTTPDVPPATTPTPVPLTARQRRRCYVFFSCNNPTPVVTPTAVPTPAPVSVPDPITEIGNRRRASGRRSGACPYVSGWVAQLLGC